MCLVKAAVATELKAFDSIASQLTSLAFHFQEDEKKDHEVHCHYKMPKVALIPLLKRVMAMTVA